MDTHLSWNRNRLKMAKSKRGRQPIDRERYPSGQIRPQEGGITASAWHRLRALGTDPRLATEIGRLAFKGDLSATQADAGFSIGRIFAGFDRAVGIRRWPASPPCEMGRGRDYNLAESEQEQEANKAALNRFNALGALLRPLRADLRAALVGLCVDDAAVPFWMFPEVKATLDSLAPHLGLRRRKKF